MPRNQKYWKRRFGDLDDNINPYYHHLDLRRIDDLDDEGFAYLLTNAKGVNMLDLNETEITNESIKLIAALEYVKELRAKGCYLDNDCVTDLNKIPTLELLHLKNTAVTIDGLLQLNNLTNLRKLFFSADDVEAIKEKLLQLKAMHPACEFIIDGKPYYFDNIERFMYAAKAKPYTYNLNILNSPAPIQWSKWLIKPSNSYYETEIQGPYHVQEIEWIEINPLEVKQTGNLVPVKIIDHSNDIVQVLEELSIPYMIVESMIRMYIVKTSLT